MLFFFVDRAGHILQAFKGGVIEFRIGFTSQVVERYFQSFRDLHRHLYRRAHFIAFIPPIGIPIDTDLLTHVALGELLPFSDHCQTFAERTFPLHPCLLASCVVSAPGFNLNILSSLSLNTFLHLKPSSWCPNGRFRQLFKDLTWEKAHWQLPAPALVRYLQRLRLFRFTPYYYHECLMRVLFEERFVFDNA